MKFLIAGILLLTATADALIQSISNPIDYSAPLTGSKKCALFNVLMDESGSMAGDQAFMKSEEGMPKITRKVVSYGYDHVFVCIHGYGAYNQRVGGHLLGCNDAATWSTPASAADVTYMDEWIANGRFEDSYNATLGAMIMTPDTIDGVNIASTCNEFKKNFILVTDEDRDVGEAAATQSAVDTALRTNGYVMNAIVGVRMTSPSTSYDILGYSQDATQATNGVATLYVKDGENTFATLVDREWSRWSTDGYSVQHYSPLIEGHRGVIWNINHVRSTSHVAAMSEALADIKLEEILKPDPPPPTDPETGTGGDPHFTTWKGEHYEYHGQCDMVVAKDAEFANGVGLDIHIRTKIVRFWSYIKNAAIRIGNDILEVEGSAEPSDTDNHYWINFEYQGDLNEVGGFPVSVNVQSPVKKVYEIDLNKQYPGAKLIISTYKEFVRVSFKNADEAAFGNAVGLMGDFKTGKTLARDGETVLDDFSELGNEWQVMPSEPKLFHEIDHPHFPEKCIEPEDPRGERHRRLGENTVTEEQAETACARLTDAADRKDCVYDILATQDVGMVGAY